jgi:hypothetical protein
MLLEEEDLVIDTNKLIALDPFTLLKSAIVVNAAAGKFINDGRDRHVHRFYMLTLPTIPFFFRSDLAFAVGSSPYSGPVRDIGKAYLSSTLLRVLLASARCTC